MVQNVCAMTGSVQSSRQNNNDLSLSSNKSTLPPIYWISLRVFYKTTWTGLLEEKPNDLPEMETPLSEQPKGPKNIGLEKRRTVFSFQTWFCWFVFAVFCGNLKQTQKTSNAVGPTIVYNKSESELKSQNIYISFHSINWKWKQRRKGSKSICWLQVVQHPSEQS